MCHHTVSKALHAKGSCVTTCDENGSIQTCKLAMVWYHQNRREVMK